MGQVMMKLTQHLHEFVYYKRDLLLEHDEYDEADVDNIEGADQLVRNRFTDIPLLECDIGRERLGWWRCIKGDVEANKPC